MNLFLKKSSSVACFDSNEIVIFNVGGHPGGGVDDPGGGVDDPGGGVVDGAGVGVVAGAGVGGVCLVQISKSLNYIREFLTIK